MTAEFVFHACQRLVASGLGSAFYGCGRWWCPTSLDPSFLGASRDCAPLRFFNAISGFNEQLGMATTKDLSLSLFVLVCLFVSRSSVSLCLFVFFPVEKDLIGKG